MAREKGSRRRKSETARPSRRELQKRADRRHRKEALAVWGGGILLVAIIVLVIFWSIRSQQPVGEEQVVATLGNTHIAQDSMAPIQYNSTPPTSGPHYGSLANWGTYTRPIRYEQLLHNLEDGGVAIYYQCEESCPEMAGQLEEVVAAYTAADRKVVMVPNDPSWTGDGSQPLHQDMDARIALTAWQRIDKFNQFDAERIRAFIERYEGIDQHR